MPHEILIQTPSTQGNTVKSSLVSIAFHATLLLAFWYVHQKPLQVAPPEPITIDFSMQEEALPPPAPEPPHEQPKPAPQQQQAAIPPEPQQPVLPDTTEPVEPDTLPPQEQVVEEQPEPEAPPTPPAPSAAEIQAQKQQAVAGYVKQQFVYIRKIIASNLAYPERAQEREQEGSLLLSFVIQENGQVKNVHVVRSSGYALLDESAVATVHKSAPFPKPPFPAELKVPVTYKLL
ncbi:MAG TPA: TonB family protein [Fibrobacteraceae bacterium]|nr:TonB family protein [Fibrobacteraceae bacterium]